MGTGALSWWENSWGVKLNTHLPDGLMMSAGKASPFTPFCYEALDVLEFMSKSQCLLKFTAYHTDRQKLDLLSLYYVFKHFCLHCMKYW